MPSRPRARASSVTSRSTTSQPAWAETCAMPDPMSPAPMTASFLATLAPLCMCRWFWSMPCPPAEVSTRGARWGCEEMRVTSQMTDITPGRLIRRRAGRS